VLSSYAAIGIRNFIAAVVSDRILPNKLQSLALEIGMDLIGAK